MNLSMKVKQTHRHRDQTCGHQGGRGKRGGRDWESGISRCKLVYTEWINNSSYCTAQGAISSALLQSFSHVQLFVTPWTVASWAPLSMEFSRQEYWSGLPFPSLRHLSNPGIKPRSPALQADSLPSEASGKSHNDKSYDKP